jgi:hypothetical protein
MNCDTLNVHDAVLQGSHDLACSMVYGMHEGSRWVSSGP